MKFSIVIPVLFAIPAQAHIMIMNPNSRLASDSVKFSQPNPANPTTPDSPSSCGGIARTNTPLTLIQNTDLQINFRETINHPGRFIVQFSPANDQGFWLAANQLGVKVDTESNATHTMTVRVPNTTCDNCTIRLLQQMDDQPGEYYVHCVDVRIVASTSGPTPTPTPNGGRESPKQSENQLLEEERPRMGGCGSVSNSPPPSTPKSTIPLLVLPLLLSLVLRLRLPPAKLDLR